MDILKFEEIRPYFDEEIPAAMQRIVASELFPSVASYVFPNKSAEEAAEHIGHIRTIDQFQREVMAVANEQIIKRSMTSLTYGGLDRLDPAKSYLFVSNHRDIMLDSSLLQYILLVNGHQTTEITFGANLMSHPLVIDIGKANKMFKVERGGLPKDFYKSSLLHSEYIRHTITQKHRSVWIAQRNGRTKDGIDCTESGLVRMFASSMPNDKLRSLGELNIVPVSISYEWETCDDLKARELCLSRTAKYVKKQGEDLNSILTGILADKGHVHIEICKPVDTDDLLPLTPLTKQEYAKAVAQLITDRINASYYLHPNNYVASDIMSGTAKYADKYTEEQKRIFCERLAALTAGSECDSDVMREIYLGIYANPVDTSLK